MVEKRFGALRLIAAIFKALAFLILALGLLAALAMLVGGLGGSVMGPGRPGAGRLLGGMLGGVLGAGFTTFASAIYALALYAMGDLISLALAIEENTRATALWLKERSSEEKK